MSEMEIFYPKNSAEWRKWLEKNHAKKDAVWLVFHAKSTGRPTLTWSESVDVAICFGWIDSKRVSKGDGESHQYFTKRKPKSMWSKINKEKVERLIADGLMTPAGMEPIHVAKKNGSWNMLDEVEELIIPPDLKAAFDEFPGSQEYFESLPRSPRRMMLVMLVMAKRTETRAKRIAEIVEASAQRKRPKGV